MDYSIYLTEEYLYELYQNHDIEYLKNIDKEKSMFSCIFK